MSGNSAASAPASSVPYATAATRNGAAAAYWNTRSPRRTTSAGSVSKLRPLREKREADTLCAANTCTIQKPVYSAHWRYNQHAWRTAARAEPAAEAAGAHLEDSGGGQVVGEDGATEGEVKDRGSLSEARHEVACTFYRYFMP